MVEALFYILAIYLFLRVGRNQRYKTGATYLLFNLKSLRMRYRAYISSNDINPAYKDSAEALDSLIENTINDYTNINIYMVLVNIARVEMFKKYSTLPKDYINRTQLLEKLLEDDNLKYYFTQFVDIINQTLSLIHGKSIKKWRIIWFIVKPVITIITFLYNLIGESAKQMNKRRRTESGLVIILSSVKRAASKLNRNTSHSDMTNLTEKDIIGIAL